MTWMEWLEALSYLVTVIGLPVAILIFVYEQRKERQNEEYEIYQRLSDEYGNFLKLVLENADLNLSRPYTTEKMTEEQTERKRVLFALLVALFERAFIMVYEEEMSRQRRRLWASWEDYMGEWCRREDFRNLLPELLQGEDPDFCSHIVSIAERERVAMRP
ncbi:MAG: hypothetical protein JXR37_31815 [Kiritimatiellae bacterium]|nr:hypothetical protein [Kiritimatiellia bacterium]